MLIYSEKDIEKYKSMVGAAVVKRRSGKPFKSGFKVNTVKAADTIHPNTGRLCFTFFEDESYVECHICVPVPPLTSEDVERQYQDGIHIGSGLPRATCPCGFCEKYRTPL